MTYSETLDYLFAQLPMYQRIGQAAYKADLDSTKRLMEHLGHPEHKFKAIHVGGTNGKGSISHLLASVFQEAGYKTGLYTSPHLIDFRERVRINGQMISEETVVSFVSKHKEIFDSMQLSFFEWTVGLAFNAFAEEAVDIAIIEVGMGGRLDSTNVIYPELSIISNISMDHSAFLGDSLDRIAVEKAGIIKANTPVIIGRSTRETEGVFRKTALAQEARIHFADQEFPREVPSHPLGGKYQEENLQSVLIALEVMKEKGWNLTDESIQQGFMNVISNTGIRGRWERLEEKPVTIIDVAHNVDAIEHNIDQLKSEGFNHIHFVLGFVADKDVAGILELFPKEATYYLCAPSVPRRMPLDRLKIIADQIDMRYEVFDGVRQAYEAAKSQATDDDVIYVGGSAFIVADFIGGS